MKQPDFETICAKYGIQFVNRSYGKATTSTITKDALDQLAGEFYGHGVTAGKLEALNYSPKEKENYLKWAKNHEC